MYRRAWHTGLKTTYYLRTLGASDIEKATIDGIERRSTTTLDKKEKDAKVY